MRNRNYFVLLSVMFLLLLSVPPSGGQNNAPQPAPTGDAESVRQLQNIVNSYAQSVNELDLTLARKLWSAGPDVTFIHPRGTERGLEQILANVYGASMGRFSKRELLPENVNIHVYGDTAWSEFTWTFHAIAKESGQNITNRGRETQIYRKEGGSWRIVHVHYSGMPVS